MKKFRVFLLILILALALPSAAFATVENATISSQIGDMVTGPLTAYAPLGDDVWASAPQTPGVLAWDASYPALDPARAVKYISDLRYVIPEHQGINTWRLYHKEFMVGCAASGEITGVLKVNSDNAEEAYVNGVLVGTDGLVNSTELPRYHEPGQPDVFEWTTIQTYNITLQPGLNKLDFIVRNYASTALNPTSLAYKLDYTCPTYSFSGFYQPIDNPGSGPDYVFNSLKAGAAVPVKFSLAGDQGLSILAAGYPVSQPVACSSASAFDPVDETITAGNSSLSYDATSDTYTYVWKTDKNWVGTCRALTVTFIDGMQYLAYFHFK